MGRLKENRPEVLKQSRGKPKVGTVTFDSSQVYTRDPRSHSGGLGRSASQGTEQRAEGWKRVKEPMGDTQQG